MPDKSNNDELYLEDDLAADFLNETDLTGQSALDAPAAPPGVSPTPEPMPVSRPPMAKKPLTTPEEVVSTDTKDWVDDDAKITDLPGQLALDIYETKDHLVILCRVAGVKEDLDVSISDANILNIRGNLTNGINDNVENHFIQECYWGEFSRSISLPVDVKKEGNNINATLENGILRIEFVKIKQDAIKKINIKTKN